MHLWSEPKPYVNITKAMTKQNVFLKDSQEYAPYKIDNNRFWYPNYSLTLFAVKTPELIEH